MNTEMGRLHYYNGGDMWVEQNVTNWRSSGPRREIVAREYSNHNMVQYNLKDTSIPGLARPQQCQWFSVDGPTYMQELEEAALKNRYSGLCKMDMSTHTVYECAMDNLIHIYPYQIDPSKPLHGNSIIEFKHLHPYKGFNSHAHLGVGGTNVEHVVLEQDIAGLINTTGWRFA